jgi:predicted porin
MNPIRRIPFVLAFAGAYAGLVPMSSMAQSNVTIYGVMDGALTYSNEGKGGLFRQQSGGYQGSRLGFRGVEDLGGGFKAIFLMEGGLNLDDGTQGQGRAWGRQVYVGLSNAWGTLSLGRQYTPYYYSELTQDAFIWGNVGGIPALTKTTNGTAASLLQAYNGQTRDNNSINIQTAPIYNWTLRALYALGETSGSAANEQYGVSAIYLNGPASFGMGYGRGKDSFGRGYQTVANVGGSYDFGPVQAFAGFTLDRNGWMTSATATRPTDEYRLFNLGARYKVTPLLTAIGQVVRIQDKSQGLTVNRDATSLAVGLEYNFSRRTLLYTSVGTVGNRNGSGYSMGMGTTLGGPVVGNARSKSAGIGIRHSF